MSRRKEDKLEMIPCWRETCLLGALVVVSWMAVISFFAWVLL